MSIIINPDSMVFTTGAFLQQMKVRDSMGKDYWVWYVSEFIDDTYKDGEVWNPSEWIQALLSDNDTYNDAE
ncbi:hypothetical protein FACS189454_04800 [Planctomycetales bacterium]|nr:hypothetical protein FACS189454_04800 [Planctomycetales bacterium]